MKVSPSGADRLMEAASNLGGLLVCATVVSQHSPITAAIEMAERIGSRIGWHRSRAVGFRL